MLTLSMKNCYVIGIVSTSAYEYTALDSIISKMDNDVEGFFDVCAHQGLDGTHGVIIPRTNVADLMLREDVVQAVEDGKFSVYAVDTVDDGIEILTGIKAGAMNKHGAYPKKSVNYEVQQSLEHFYKCYAKYARETKGCLGK